MPAQGTPTPPLVGGTSAKPIILQDYVFQSGIHKPEHSSILTWKYPQYYLTSLLDRLGRSEGIAQDVWSWNIIDRTRKGGTVSALAGGTTASATFEIAEFPADGSTTFGYLIVGDVVRFESGELGRVTAVGNNGGNQTATVARVAGGNWSATLIANAFKFGHVYSLFGENSSAPSGRIYLPEEGWNALGTVRRSFKISGSEFTNRTYLGDGEAWYFTQEEIEMQEFARDKEAQMLFGTRVGANGSVKSSYGLYDYIDAGGVKTGFSAGTGVAEADIQNHITDLLIEGGSRDYLVLCGAEIFTGVQKALRDYHISGGVDYGTFGGQKIGLDVQSYKFGGITANFVFYELFNDQAMVPTPASALSSTVRDFSNLSLWVDLGKDKSGQPLVSLKHKELNGRSRKFIHNYVAGMMGPEGPVSGSTSNGDDSFQINLLGECGIEVRKPNVMGILGANAA